MQVRIIGDGECARATRGLLRKAGFAVTDYLPGEAVPGAPVYGPLFGYGIQIEESADRRTEHIHFDSVDCELEANILKHVTALSKHPVMVDRPGGVVHSDREIRIVVPAHLPGQQPNFRSFDPSEIVLVVSPAMQGRKYVCLPGGLADRRHPV
jgi:hypothetical protein